MALRGQGRRERALVGVAHRRPLGSRRCSSGASTPPPAISRRAGRPRLLLLRLAGRRARTSASPRRRSAGAVAGWSTPGRPHRTRASTAACGRRTWRRSSSAGSSTSRRRRRSRRRSSSRICRTATRSCCPGSATRCPSGPSSPKPARRLVNTFLDSGKVDDSLYKPAKRRLHARDQPRHDREDRRSARCSAWRSLTVLSLLWMARRVHKRGRFGRTAGATCCGRCTRSCSASADGSSAP